MLIYSSNVFSYHINVYYLTCEKQYRKTLLQHYHIYYILQNHVSAVHVRTVERAPLFMTFPSGVSVPLVGEGIPVHNKVCIVLLTYCKCSIYTL